MKKFIRLLPSFSLKRKPKPPSEPNPLRLHAPRGRRPDIELGAPHEILGVKLLEEEKYMPRAIFTAHGRKNTNGEYRAVVYHPNPISLLELLQGYLGDATILIRSVPRDARPFLNRLNKIRKGQNSDYGELVENFKEWALPRYDPNFDGRAIYGRDLLFWGTAGRIFPAATEKTAALYGMIPTFDQVGSTIYAVLHRLPMPIIRLKGGREYIIPQRVHPLLYAAPANIEWRWDHYQIDNRAFAFWKGILNIERLDGILDLDVDILVHSSPEPKDQTTDRLYVTVVLRSSSEVVDGKTPKLELIQRQLRHLGNWHRAKGDDVRLAFQAFVPGAAPLPEEWRWYRRSVNRPPIFLKGLTKTVGEASQIKGDLVLGLSKQPFFIDAQTRTIASVVEGKPGAGKTTFSSAVLGLQKTPNVLMVQLSTARGEAAPIWARKFGGQLRELELPDSTNPDEELLLLREDEQNAAAEVQKMAERWKEIGQPIGFPIVLRPRTESVRYWNFVRAYVNAFALAWEDIFVPEEKKGKADVIAKKGDAKAKDDDVLCVVIFDDIGKWPGKAKSHTLGKLSVNIGIAGRELMHEANTNYRKRKMHVVFTVQNIDMLKDLPEGFLGSCTMLVRIKLAEKTGAKIAEILEPGRDPMEVLMHNLDVRLPPSIVDVVGRLEDWGEL